MKITELTVGLAMAALTLPLYNVNGGVNEAPAQRSPKKALSDVAAVDLHGVTVHPFAGGRRAGTLFVFIAHDCPVSNAYAREVGRICKTYEGRGIVTYIVYVEKDLKPADARMHAKDFGYPCPALFDLKRTLIHLTGARMTPEAALADRSGKIVYRGRIDDTYIDYGKRRDEPTTRDLRNAIDAFLARKPISPSRTDVVGCYIPDIDAGR